MSENSALGQSLDVVEQNRQRLLALLPEIFTEGSLNIPALKRALGDHSVVEEGEGESKAALAREFKLDRTTVYRYIGRAQAQLGRAGK